MTASQRLTRKTHTLAQTAYRNASHGERNKTRKALELAALEVLKADTAARKEREQRILNAA